METGAEPRRQIIPGQEHMPRLRQPVVNRKIGVIELIGHRNDAITPTEPGLLVCHAVFP
jgi:hypothetical protein